VSDVSPGTGESYVPNYFPMKKQRREKIHLKFHSNILLKQRRICYYLLILDTGDLHGRFFKFASSCSGCACYFLKVQNSKLEIDDKPMHWSKLSLFHTLHSVQETILILRYSLNSHGCAISLLIFAKLDYMNNWYLFGQFLIHWQVVKHNHLENMEIFHALIWQRHV